MREQKTEAAESGEKHGQRHVFELVLNTNPVSVVVTAALAKELGLGHVLTGSGNPVMITEDGAGEIDMRDP